MINNIKGPLTIDNVELQLILTILTVFESLENKLYLAVM